MCFISLYTLNIDPAAGAPRGLLPDVEDERLQLLLLVYSHIYIYIYVYIYICICMYVCMYMCIYIHTHVYIGIHILYNMVDLLTYDDY